MSGLTTHVALFDEQGVLHQFGPGSDVPAWAARKITNPNVWEGGDAPEGGDDGDGDGPPPKAGKGSGEDKWRAYAERRGVDVSEAEGRDDVITLLELAEVPTE
jgi:hypothetical protein